MFRVGQKVVCVDDGLGILGNIPVNGLPIVGEIYTISNIGTTQYGGLGVNVIECEHDQPAGWRASRFRPIVERKTDIAIFTEMLNGAPHKIREDA